MRKMVAGLTHQYKWATDIGKFFHEIDKCGGWPVGFTYVGFEHTDERAAGFTNSSYNDGWWTVIATADDYYLWKLSEKAKLAFSEEVRRRLVISPINMNSLFLPQSHWLGHITTSDSVSKGDPK